MKKSREVHSLRVLLSGQTISTRIQVVEEPVKLNAENFLSCCRGKREEELDLLEHFEEREFLYKDLEAVSEGTRVSDLTSHPPSASKLSTATTIQSNLCTPYPSPSRVQRNILKTSIEREKGEKRKKGRK